MRKLLLTTLFCLSLAFPALADQQTTVLSENVTLEKAQVLLPSIDGSNEKTLEQSLNGLLRKKAGELAKSLGGGEVNYKVVLNRPSLVSVLLEGTNGNKKQYLGLNLDLTTGAEFSVQDFFVDMDALRNVVGDYKNVLFSEEGFYVRAEAGAAYDKFVPYADVLPYLRIGEAGRLLQVAKLTEQVAGKTLTLEHGGLFAIKLNANPSTGFGWQVIAPSEITRVGSTFTIPGKSNAVGTPGVEILFFAVTQPGTYNIKMEYKRSWEKFSLNTFNFTVVVKE